MSEIAATFRPLADFLKQEVVVNKNELRRHRYSHYNAVMRVANAFSPVISVERKSVKPLHRQIYDSYRTNIVTRNLSSGQQVPSSRTLAAELGISRIPVLNAYAQLLAEGYFESRTGAGTFVSSSLPDQLTSCDYRKIAPDRIQSGPRLFSKRSSLIALRDDRPRLGGWGAFNVGQLTVDDFPSQVWSNLVTRHARNVNADSANYSGAMGRKDFREAIANYLRTSRAVHCEAQQIMIVNGSQQALEISASVLLDPGSPVWVEDPGYAFLRHCLTMTRCRIISVPVDKEGLKVTAGIQRCCKARVAYVTPSHQFPLGATMSASRRLQLLEWAQSTGAWIIEDDYDSEYRYENLPIASLQGLDHHSRVIYIGTFSKTMFPALRLGYIVIPPDLIERFVAVRHATDLFPPHLFQAVLTDFINEGHFARHIRKMRLIYSERRSALVNSLQNEFGSSLEVSGEQAGMHLVVTLPNGMSDKVLAERAAKEKLWLWPLSPCYLEQPCRQGFILGFGSTKTTEMPRAVRRLRALFK